MKQLLTIIFISTALYAQAQLPSVITCWEINPGTDTGFAGILTNAQAVQYSDSSVYISTTDIASWIPVGYNWPNNPWLPQNMGYTFKITRYPQPNHGTLLATPNGHIGLWKNGVSVYNPKDTKSYNDSNVWFQNAFYFEHIQHETFDPCWGHPNQSHEYHTHQSPACLYDDTDSGHHSPLIGYAFDGYPIYGAYGYASPNTIGAVKRMASSYRLRAMSTRDTLPDGTVLAPIYQGPRLDSIPPGAYMEDFEYVQGLGDLDVHNGRWCKTPEYPAGTYAYFVTLDNTMAPVYPYTIGLTYYGIVQNGNTGPGGGHNTPPGGTTIYTTGVAQVSDKAFAVQVYPNPTAYYVNVFIQAIESNNFTATLTDESGRTVLTQNNIQPTILYSLNVSSFAPGIYTLCLKNKDITHTEKVVISK